jgi:aryl-alcohol dehydrogenase-like predicted oxidoreductase
MGVIPWSPLAGGWLSGRYTKGGESPGSSRRAQMLPSRYDMSIPGNQAKLDAAEKLAEVAEQAGLPLIEMSIRFVTSHRAVTAAIIGPRTMDQLESQLTALEQPVLPGEVLDRIDEIVPPGTNVNQADTGWDPPWLTDPSLRRR